MENLKTLNVEEMSVHEMKKTEGGFLIWLLAGVIVGIAAGYVFFGD